MTKRTLPRVKSVEAAKTPLSLNVAWDDGTKSRVDLTGLVHSSRHFAVFAEDQAASSPNPELPDFLTALREQLGLRLEGQQGPGDVVVIDRAEKASAN